MVSWIEVCLCLSVCSCAKVKLVMFLIPFSSFALTVTFCFLPGHPDLPKASYIYHLFFYYHYNAYHKFLFVIFFFINILIINIVVHFYFLLFLPCYLDAVYSKEVCQSQYVSAFNFSSSSNLVLLFLKKGLCC